MQSEVTTKYTHHTKENTLGNKPNVRSLSHFNNAFAAGDRVATTSFRVFRVFRG
jgi:hypothetical protein